MGSGVKRASTLATLSKGSLEKHMAETQLRAEQQAEETGSKRRLTIID